jgi:hypothetical protein
MAKIDNINDRKILVLLTHKERKSCCDKRRIKRLECLYPDHQNHERHLVHELLQSRHLQSSYPTPPKNNEFNQVIVTGEPTISTSKDGLYALKKGKFPSESAAKNKAKWDRKLEWVYKILAILGGLYALVEIALSLIAKWCNLD